MLLLLEGQPFPGIHLGGPDGLGAEPRLETVAEPGVVAEAEGETHVAQLDAEGTEKLAQRPEALQLGRAVEAVAGRGTARRHEPRLLDVAQHPGGPAGRGRRLVDRQPVGSHHPQPYHDCGKVVTGDFVRVRTTNLLKAMILSDQTIREELANGRIGIDPLGEGCIQPSSVDLHVDRYFRVFRNHNLRAIDVKEDQEELTELVVIAEDDVLMLHPGEFVLGSTVERVRLPNDLVGRLEGKSSLGRLGLLIHSTAGFVDAGWDGHLTLELSNVANLPITLYPGMKIGQISFLKMTTPAAIPYGSAGLGSKYQHQRGPTPSRYFENFRDRQA